MAAKTTNTASRKHLFGGRYVSLGFGFIKSKQTFNPKSTYFVEISQFEPWLAEKWSDSKILFCRNRSTLNLGFLGSGRSDSKINLFQVGLLGSGQTAKSTYLLKIGP